MSPGIWNNIYYSSEEIKQSFSRTDWKSKEVRSLFLDHVDDSSKEWVGEIQNPKITGDVVRGDLAIVDQPTAIKLAYGAKMGISPKVTGQTEEGENVMHQFVYDNFSVVINPAVKTAWINNADMVAFEKIRKEKGMTPEEFYAIPMDPPSASKLPIYDAAHVRNALARFNQVKGVSAEDLAKAKRKIIAAAKKFNIKVNGEKMEEQNMDDKEDINPEATIANMEEVDQDLLDYTEFIKKNKEENPEWSLEQIATEYEKQKENAKESVKMNKLLQLADQLINLAEQLKIVKNEEKDKEDPKDDEEDDKKDDKEDDKEEDEDKDIKNSEDSEPDKKDKDKDKDKDKEDDEDEGEKDKKDSNDKEKKNSEDDKDKETKDENNTETEDLKKKNEELMQKINSINKDHTKTLNQLNGQFNELKKELEEPDKLSVKTVSMSNNKSGPKFVSGAEDIDFLNALKYELGGN